ncbi:MAG: helix-turn-helix domain-containing protein [Planctomycetota bacterium]
MRLYEARYNMSGEESNHPDAAIIKRLSKAAGRLKALRPEFTKGQGLYEETPDDTLFTSKGLAAFTRAVTAFCSALLKLPSVGDRLAGAQGSAAVFSYYQARARKPDKKLAPPKAADLISAFRKLPITWHLAQHVDASAWTVVRWIEAEPKRQAAEQRGREELATVHDEAADEKALETRAALFKTGGNVKQAAKLLGVSPKTVYNRAKRFRIDLDSFRRRRRDDQPDV